MATKKLFTGINALVISIVFLSILNVVRCLFTLKGGYMTADEALYFSPAIFHLRTGTPIEFYGHRTLFQFLITVPMLIFNINNVFKMIVLASGISLFLTVLTQLFLFKISAIIFKDKMKRFLLVLTYPALAIFSIMSVTYLTEPLSIFAITAFIYFTICFFKNGNSYKQLFFMIIFLNIVVLTRETNMMIFLANLIVIPIFMMKYGCSFKQLTIFVGLTLPFARIPLSIDLSSIMIIEPLVNYFTITFTNIVSQITQSFQPHYVSQTVTEYSSTGIVPVSSMEAYPPSELYTHSPLSDINLSRFFITAKYFILSLFIGWNPIFAMVGLSCFIVFIKNMKKTDFITCFLFINGIAAIISFVFLTFYTMDPFVIDLINSVPLGTLIRYVHVSIPASLMMVMFYKRLEQKHITVFVLILIITLGSTTPFAMQFIQKGFSTGYVERISTDYMAPYYRAYLYADDSGETLMFFGHNSLLLSLYMLEKPNVVLARPTSDQVSFRHIINSRDYDSIIFYGVKHFTHDSGLKEYFPYYHDVITFKTKYQLEVLYEDEEMYLYRLMK